MRHSLYHVSSFRYHGVTIKEKYPKNCYKPMIPIFPSTIIVKFNTKDPLKVHRMKKSGFKVNLSMNAKLKQYISWGSNIC